MQFSFRFFVTVIACLVLGMGCYAHTGQPYGTDEDGWFERARQACERGDLPAFEALIQRSGREADCDPPDITPR